jgi:hypothetical protein
LRSLVEWFPYFDRLKHSRERSPEHQIPDRQFAHSHKGKIQDKLSLL